MTRFEQALIQAIKLAGEATDQAKTDRDRAMRTLYAMRDAVERAQEELRILGQVVT